MSSSCGIGLSSSTSIFSGGLCSGNTRRPSMFTAKYRLREERKKVLKLSLSKVKRIEDPESFLRRSVLINNTIKRLQREVREEKMLRNGGSHFSPYSKISPSFRKSYASSRLHELVDSDDSICNTTIITNSRKRKLLMEENEEECDVNAVLSQIYNPPTPCRIPDNSENENNENGPDFSSLTNSNECLSNQIKRAKKDEENFEKESFNKDNFCDFPITVVESETDVDVDVVGDSDGGETEWRADFSQNLTLSQDFSQNSPTNLSADFSQNSPTNLSVDFCRNSANLTSDFSQSSPTNLSSDYSQSSPNANYSSNLSDDFLQDSPTNLSTDYSQNFSPSPNFSPNFSRHEPQDDVMSGFTLDLHLARGENGEMEISSETKENNCEKNPASSLSNNKCSSLCTSNQNPSPNVIVQNNNNGPSLSSLPPSPPSSPINDNNNSTDKNSNFSSCGHSSIFGELQSVVFHSLITSLET